MDWITENIAIGNFIDAENATKDEVDAILCLKPDCCLTLGCVSGLFLVVRK